MKKFTKLSVIAALLISSAAASAAPKKNPHLRITDKEFFVTDEARRIGDQLLCYQRVTGGWPKNIDMERPLSSHEVDSLKVEQQRRDDSTIDNNATIMQLAFLARLFQATADTRYSDAFARGLEFLLSGQYDDGGWPQFWPVTTGYQEHITFNDYAITNTLEMFRDIANETYPYNGAIVSPEMRRTIATSFNKGIECILATQIITDGEPTVWCQQHDRHTYKPAPARAYELPSYCSQESVPIVKLLMGLPNPDERVKKAVIGAMKWFDKTKLTGLRIERRGTPGTDDYNTVLVSDPDALPIWARFYDLENCEPYVCDRDGIPRKSLEEIGRERRNGYSWYNSFALELYPLYEEWLAKL